ncbi:MAG: (Fe-S)-binding protein [Candidatus Heimdallarchaeota archaeon]
MTGQLVGSAKLQKVQLCIADPSKIRVIGQLDHEVGEVLPYLYVELPTATYSEKLGVLSFKEGTRLITIYASGTVMMTKIQDETEAQAILNRLCTQINTTYARRNEIDLSAVKTKIRLGPFDLYEYLPKTNCQECGEPGCVAFSVKLLDGSKRLTDCMPLTTENYRENRAFLLELLKSAGYKA